jgi:DNA-binding CsgD family transcriptional regulator
MLEEVPLGLLLLDAACRPLWYNREAALVCAVWNHGERCGAALRLTSRVFTVPPALRTACAEELRKGADRAGRAKPRFLSEPARGLHARITLRPAGPLQRPVLYLQLDYRRPRKDREIPLSPTALAMCARLTGREREVAMRVREGLTTPEIAAALQRSPLTIKSQIAAILKKLDVKNRVQVAALLNR